MVLFVATIIQLLLGTLLHGIQICPISTTIITASNLIVNLIKSEKIKYTVPQIIHSSATSRKEYILNRILRHSLIRKTLLQITQSDPSSSPQTDVVSKRPIRRPSTSATPLLHRRTSASLSTDSGGESLLAGSVYSPHLAFVTFSSNPPQKARRKFSLYIRFLPE